MQSIDALAAQATRTSEERQRLEHNKLSKRLMREAGRAIADYNMIEAGDRIMVCLSGGKDSYGMLDILMTLRQRAHPSKPQPNLFLNYLNSFENYIQP